jgi:hypothetical protein
MAEAQTPEQTYRARAAAFAARRDHFARQSSRAANLNLVLFVAAVGCLALGLWRSDAWLLAFGVAFASGFVISFVRHGRIDARQREFAARTALSEEGLYRLARDWARLPLRHAAPADPLHPYAADLDLTSHGSLLHLLGTTSSPAGAHTLRGWLLAPAAPEVILRRQGAVAELATQIDLRDELALAGRRVGATQQSYERFRTWAEQQPWLLQRPALIWASRLLPLATLALLAAQGLGVVPYPLALLPFAVSTLLSYTIGRRVDSSIDAVAERQETLRAYAALFAQLGTQPWRAAALRDVQAQLHAGQLRADQQLGRLAALMPLADLRGWMFFVPIQLLTLWNFHVLYLLERWRLASGARVGPWLDALGECEALAALAALHHDQPTWCFPVVDASATEFEARQLAHPLLPDGVRVGNDLSVGPPGTFLLVTGSNMAGKSTLLRAIGLNAVLAQAGAPVCAAALRLPPFGLATSMRVQDSLVQGVSYFMAELQRLKAVVARAEHVRADGGPTLLFLLDEILQGTNTAERQIAARHIIRHLLALGATGAVSTHDLALADTPALAAVGRPVHLSEYYQRDASGLQMRFDYRLQPGIAPSTNALKLMELVGLPPLDEGQDRVQSAEATALPGL